MILEQDREQMNPDESRFMKMMLRDETQFELGSTTQGNSGKVNASTRVGGSIGGSRPARDGGKVDSRRGDPLSVD